MSLLPSAFVSFVAGDEAEFAVVLAPVNRRPHREYNLEASDLIRCHWCRMLTSASAHDLTKGGAKVSVVFDQPLPNVPGKSMKGVLVEYAPGQSSPAHTHRKSAFI